MKNIKQIITIITLMILFFSINANSQKINTEEIVSYHNETLKKLIFTKEYNWKEIGIDKIEDNITIILNKKDSKKFSISKLNVIKKQLDIVFFSTVKNKEDFKFKNLGASIDYLVNNKLIDNELATYLYSIYNEIHNKNIKGFKEKFKIFKSVKFNSTENEVYRKLFITMWDSSNEFWSNDYEKWKNSANSTAKKWSWDWQDTVVIFSDAFGVVAGTAVAGGASGGLMAVAGGAFGGAYASAFVGSLL